jgi:fimbrial chaperone protein
MTKSNARPAAARATLVMAIAVGAALTAGQRAFGAASVMIWPINPVIASDARATALWLENRGAAAVTLQIRVLGWTQHDYGDRFEDAPQELVTSPPLATIAPGRRQLVRLMRTRDVPANSEISYRVLIDEVPGPESLDATRPGDQAAMGVTFRMRYSVPLFVYGRGMQPPETAASRREAASAGQPALSWRLINDERGRFLQLRNAGSTHARLSNVQLVTPATGFDVATGLLGYVLPGADMRWPLPDGAPDGDGVALRMAVNGTVTTVRPY